MNELISQLEQDFPQFVFKPHDDPHWSPRMHTIHYDPNDPVGTLHELGHAICNHQKYGRDIELVIMEREAWDRALELSRRYGIDIDPDEIEDYLDTYRDWLDKRSRCPKCHQTGWQDQQQLTYHCPNCGSSWQANDARKTALRRRLI